jgi:hypothetical protein
VKHNSIIIHEAINFAWTTFKKHYPLLTAILLTIFGAWVVLEIIVIAGQRFGLVWWTVAHLAFFFIFAGIEVGFVQACFALYDGKEPTFTDTFGYLPLGLKFLAGQVLYLLITIIGLVFLIIPGVYFSVRYAFISFRQVAGEERLSQSFQQSAILSTGNHVSLLALIGSLLVFNVIGACFLGIGLLITIPLSTLTMTAIYKQVTE